MSEAANKPGTDDDQTKRRRQRSIAIALGLGFMVLLFYAATIVRIGGNVAKPRVDLNQVVVTRV